MTWSETNRSEERESVFFSALQLEQVGCAEKLCGFLSVSAALPSPPGQTAVPPEGRISSVATQKTDSWPSTSYTGLRSQPPRPCSRPQTHTQPALCGLWVNQPLKDVILLSIPFYSVWLRFCHPACSNTYECKKMYLYKGLRKVTEYSSMAFTNAEESTSCAGSDEWMKPAVKHACRSGTRGAHKHPTVVINDQALWTKKNSLHLASR